MKLCHMIKKQFFLTLPEEYAETVFKKSVDFIQNHSDFPSGKLIFNTAAHCEVGSSKAIFGILTDILLHLLLVNERKFDSKAFEEILNRALIFK